MERKVIVSVVIAVRDGVVLHSPIENGNFKFITFLFEFALHYAVKYFGMRNVRRANAYFFFGTLRAKTG